MSLEVFISYAPEDQKFLDELVTHLSNLRKQKIITAWHKGNIIPGTEREPETLTHLRTAQIILLLISPDFMNSEYCYGIEMNHAIARHNSGEARVIPIILRPTDWEGTPFAKLQPLPIDEEPVVSSKWHSLDEAFNNVARGIRRAIEEWVPRISPNLLERLDDLFAELRASTKTMYRRDIAAYDKFAKAKGLDFYDSKTLDTWRDEMRSANKSPNTINRMLAAVRSLFHEAAKRDLVDSGVAFKFERVSGVKEKTLKTRLKPHSRTRISPEDMRRLCESPNVKTPVGKRDRALLATLASSGVKVSELASLTKSQITAKDGGYQLSVRGSADVDYRDAALSREAKEMIDQWLAARSIESDYIFTSFAGKGNRPVDKPITTSGLWKLVVKYAEHCGLKDLKPHDFRRFVGIQLAATDPHKAQKALGLTKFSDMRDYLPDDLPVGITDNLY